MIYGKSVAILLAMGAQAALAELAPEDGQGRSLWNPGLRYETTIRYSFKMKNCRISPDPEKYYIMSEGGFETPELEFCPIIHYWTDQVIQKGHNFAAVRKYDSPEVVLKGAQNLKWKSDRHWINPVGWLSHAVKYFDKDMRGFEKLRDGDVTEEFMLFSFGDGSTVKFDPHKNVLYLSWTDATLSDFFSQKTEVNSMDVRMGTGDESVRDVMDRGMLGLFIAPPIVRDTIRAECNVSASVIFDKPGNGLAIDPNRRKWVINAGAINNLLANDKLKEFVKFSGSLRVKRRTVQLSEMLTKRMPPFKATCVEAYDSKGMQVGFDTGSGFYETFPVTISQSQDENSVEFWFDDDNEVLRYAKIKIANHDYNGNLPNPGLGEMISKIRGRAKGDMEFVCEYITEVTKPLANP